MTDDTDTPVERLDLEPAVLPLPVDGTGGPLPPLPESAYPPGATPLLVDEEVDP